MEKSISRELDDMLSMFSSLGTEKKATVLAMLGFELTVLTRETYAIDSETVAKPKQLRLYNEIQHKLLGQIHKILSHDENRYPDDVFFDMIVDMAEHAGVLTKLRTVLKKLSDVQGEVFFGEREEEALYA